MPRGPPGGQRRHKALSVSESHGPGGFRNRLFSPASCQALRTPTCCTDRSDRTCRACSRSRFHGNCPVLRLSFPCGENFFGVGSRTVVGVRTPLLLCMSRRDSGKTAFDESVFWLPQTRACGGASNLREGG